MERLRADYRRGLVLGIAFCVFAMPMLTCGQGEEEEEEDSVDGAAAADIGQAVAERLVDALEDALEETDAKHREIEGIQ